MSEKSCFIFGAGEFSGLRKRPAEGSLIIAADGGLNAVSACGLSADIVVGDFDSLGKVPQSGNVITLPAEKDTTDMYEAVSLGEKRGFTEFHIYGGTGGRPDHTFANLQMLGGMARRGLRGFLYGNGFVFTAISSGQAFRVNGRAGDYVSVFSLSDKSEGVTLKGLRYPLDDYTLTCDFPLGVSNEFTEQTAEVSVNSGTLLIYYTTERTDTV